MFTLQTSGLPVSGTAASVSDGNDLDGGCCLSVNYRVGKMAKEKFSRPVQMQRPTFWIAANFTDGVIERKHKAIGCRRIALSVPKKSSSGFRDGFGMEVNAWTSHVIVREFGDALRTRELFLPFPYPNRRCAARSPYSTLLPHPRLPNHPSFQSGDRQARLALRRVDEEPVVRPFSDSCSCPGFYSSYSHQHNLKTAEARWLTN